MNKNFDEYVAIVKKVRDMAGDPRNKQGRNDVLRNYLNTLEDEALMVVQTFFYGHLLREAAGVEFHNPYEDGEFDETGEVTTTQKITDPEEIVFKVVKRLKKD